MFVGKFEVIAMTAFYIMYALLMNCGLFVSPCLPMASNVKQKSPAGLRHHLEHRLQAVSLYMRAYKSRSVHTACMTRGLRTRGCQQRLFNHAVASAFIQSVIEPLAARK